MMRKIILISIMMFGLFATGQCKITTKYDKFEKSVSFRTDAIDIQNKMQVLQLSVTKIVKDSLSSYAIFTTITEGCTTSKSYLQFLNDKGETIKSNYKGRIRCGTSSSYFILTEAELKIIQQSTITDIRVFYDSDFDIELNDKSKAKLKDLLTCILEAK